MPKTASTISIKHDDYQMNQPLHKFAQQLKPSESSHVSNISSSVIPQGMSYKYIDPEKILNLMQKR